MLRSWLYVLGFISVSLLEGCRQDVAKGKLLDSASPVLPPKKVPLFTLLPPEQTNIDFSNILTEGPNTNILVYEYFYNGGGVATGDFNGDGLTDIYFSANMSKNRLYLNRGNMKFEDITAASGAGGKDGPWKTGVSLADVNGDHKLDLYLCYSGMVREENRVNQLFINEGNDANGIPHFMEKAKDFGLANAGYSNQAYFFDCDRDGDLDMLLLNHNPNALPILNEVSTAAFLKKDDALKGVRLYRQANNHFDDVTKTAGISGSALTYGLGVAIADLNNDGWPDFYISNDYAVPDYLYINNHDGTFTDRLETSMGHNSQFSMGNDVADINNDGWQDIITLDMLPKDNRRQKLLLTPDNYEKFDLNLRTGFHYQYMRNMIQLNNGNGTFSEIGQLAGVSNTDWSWAPLFADYNNDGWKDLFITNGYLRDYTNLDFIKYMDDFVKAKGRLRREDVLQIIRHMPASNVVNYIFSNRKNGVMFSDETKAWGMDRPSNSNGAAYADLDNDGDLDLVVNNVNQRAFVYQNESDKIPEAHYLQVNLHGERLNTQGIGAKIIVSCDGKKQCAEQMLSRGYLSAVSPRLHFGLGKVTRVDSLTVTWPGGKQQTVINVNADQSITLSEVDARRVEKSTRQVVPLFSEITSPVDFLSPAVSVNDFKRQPLLINQPSFSGPCMVKSDVNDDGLEDVYVGGGNGQPGALFVQQSEGRFLRAEEPAFEADKLFTDAAAVFFDANGDGHDDLYVASGGYHQLSQEDALLQDRLYLNDGKGKFTKSGNSLPAMRASKGCVAVGDVNQDGHPDLFVGGRIAPGRYPEAPSSCLLINDGKGNFSDATESIDPALKKVGMVTDAVWMDINQDQKDDLILVGEWMPVSVFVNVNGKLQNETDDFFTKDYRGWWNKIVAKDFNNDGKPDLLVGNQGTNSQFAASDWEPAEIYFKDFDNNGSVDPFFCFYVEGKCFPYVTRDELLDQIASMRKRFTTYGSYADMTINDIFKEEELMSAGHLQANLMQTTLFVSDTSSKFRISPLPLEAQYAPVHTITILDFDEDGHDDVLLCGNNDHSKIRLGKFDANYGALLKGNGKGDFQYVNQSLSGFALRGEVRSVIKVKNTLLFGISQHPVVAYRLRNKQAQKKDGAISAQ